MTHYIRYYPLFMDLKGKKCLVIGGGKTAERKAVALVCCGGRVSVVSPGLTPELKQLVKKGLVMWRNAKYSASDLENKHIVFAATGDKKVNSKVSGDCRARGIPVNVVDCPRECSFIVPAVVRSGSVTVAVSTSGSCPAGARELRKRLGRLITPATGRAMGLLEGFRKKVISGVRSPGQRRRLLRKAAKAALDMAEKGRKAKEIRACLEEIFA